MGLPYERGSSSEAVHMSLISQPNPTAGAPGKTPGPACRGRRAAPSVKRGFGQTVYLADIVGGGEADDVIGASGLETGEVLPDGGRVGCGARDDLLGVVAEEGVVVAQRLGRPLFRVLAEREVKQRHRLRPACAARGSPRRGQLVQGLGDHGRRAAADRPAV